MSEQEISLLRTELLQNYSEIAQYNSVLYSVVAAILAYAIKSDNYLICMIPYLVMFPIHFMCETRREGICRIGAYLNVFSGDNYKWENRLHELDLISKKIDERKHRRGSIYLFLTRDKMHFQYYVISFFCSLAAIHKIVNSSFSSCEMLTRIIVIVFVTVLAIVIVRKTTVFAPEQRSKYIAKWTVLKEDEKRKCDGKTQRLNESGGQPDDP